MIPPEPGAQRAGSPAGARRIIGIGSPFGDDSLGFALLDLLATDSLVAPALPPALPPDCTLHHCANPATELLALLGGAQHAVLVDAIVDGGAAGRVVCCTAEALAARSTRAGSHGLSVDAVLALAAALGVLPARVTLAGVTIDPSAATAPAGWSPAGLSPLIGATLPALAAAVRNAVRAPLSLEMTA